MITKRKLTWLGMVFVLLSTTLVISLSNPSVALSETSQFPKDLTVGIEFKGQMNFDVEFLDNGFKPPFARCPATAALIQVGLEQYELRINEFGGCGGRMSIWDLTIDKNGNVSGEAWARMINPPAETGTMLGQWWLHTGCQMIGSNPPFPGITGSWDGKTLIADTNFEGHCEGGSMWTGPDLWARVMDVEKENDGRLADGVSWEDGPIHVRFGAELTIVE